MKMVNRFFIALFILVNIFLIVELYLRFTLPDIPVVRMERDKPVYAQHPLYIFENVKASQVTESKFINETPVYKNVKYTFDNYGRRKTWQSKEGIPKHSAIFFGSSVIFGKGIADNETLPSQFAKLSPNWSVYNYAVRGWGTQQYLELLRQRDLNNEVEAPIKLLVFVISVNEETGHVQRLQGSMDLCTPCKWMKSLPVYRKNPNTKRFEFMGSFDTYMPVRFYLYKFLQNLRIVRYFRINVSKMNNEDYNIYLELISEIYQLAEKKYPDSKIVFLNYPLSDVASTEKLKKAKGYGELPILDYSLLIPKEQLSSYYFGAQWPYPKPELNKRIALKLHTDLLSK